jgi:GT2 family glycosyltransferase
MQGIAIVIPTHGRTHLVKHLLESLQREKEMVHFPVEILIIDDSDEFDVDSLRTLCKLHKARYIPGPKSVRKKRNIGIFKTQMDIILFMDSDCIATPGLLEAHFDAYWSDDIAGVLGATDFIGKSTFMWGVIEKTPFLNSFSFARRLTQAPWGPCTNLSYRKRILLQLNGFEENWPLPLGADDVDLGIRVNKAGFKIVCKPDATVLHTKETWNSFRLVMERAFRWGRMDYHLYYKRHRERLRPVLPRLTTNFIAILTASIIGLSIGHLKGILCVPLWFFLSVSFQGILSSTRSNRMNLCTVLQEILADLLGLGFEMGTYRESIVHWDFRVFIKVPERGPVQQQFVQKEWIDQAWAQWMATWVLLTIFIFW